MDDKRLYDALHLAARIHGLIWAARPRLEEELVKVLGGPGKLKRRLKSAQREALFNELPVLLLILILQAMEKNGPDLAAGETEFLKSCLVHFFSIHYVALYLDHKDPIKETMARVDWYMDGDEGAPEELFARFVFSVFPDPRGELADPLHRFVTESVSAEIERVLALAPRYHI